VAVGNTLTVKTASNETRIRAGCFRRQAARGIRQAATLTEAPLHIEGLLTCCTFKI
jgi:hypothetical protein